VRTPATRGGCAAPTRHLACPSIAIKPFVRVPMTCQASSPLPASLLDLSGAPRASPVDRGWDRGAEHRIGPRRTEVGFGTRDWVQKYVQRTQKKTFEAHWR
jgi:hypothetical protein